ncbi:DUF982 domain-containing protein [Mesorhizobium sp. YM1C-6-2]|nr:DUF982 domain-containing protein [Mesorhizobium sp. YM1C-6-2]
MKKIRAMPTTHPASRINAIVGVMAATFMVDDRPTGRKSAPWISAPSSLEPTGKAQFLRPRAQIPCEEISTTCYGDFRSSKGSSAAMRSTPHLNDQRFDPPVTVFTDPAGGQTVISDIRACGEFLHKRWPSKRTDKRRSALRACSDVESGNQSTETARLAFIAAAREVGILVNP